MRPQLPIAQAHVQVIGAGREGVTASIEEISERIGGRCFKPEGQSEGIQSNRFVHRHPLILSVKGTVELQRPIRSEPPEVIGAGNAGFIRRAGEAGHRTGAGATGGVIALARAVDKAGCPRQLLKAQIEQRRGVERRAGEGRTVPLGGFRPTPRNINGCPNLVEVTVKYHLTACIGKIRRRRVEEATAEGVIDNRWIDVTADLALGQGRCRRTLIENALQTKDIAVDQQAPPAHRIVGIAVQIADGIGCEGGIAVRQLGAGLAHIAADQGRLIYHTTGDAVTVTDPGYLNPPRRAQIGGTGKRRACIGYTEAIVDGAICIDQRVVEYRRRRGACSRFQIFKGHEELIAIGGYGRRHTEVGELLLHLHLDLAIGADQHGTHA